MPTSLQAGEWQQLFDRARGIAQSWGRALNLNLSEIGTTQIVMAIAAALIVFAGIGVWLAIRKRRTERLRDRFGGAEYTRAVREGGGRRQAEAALGKRTDRVEGLHIRPLAPGDRARFIASWDRVQARFVDGPGSAVTDADQLVGDVMSIRGYPVSDFEQRVADISVDHPLVTDNYRAAHRGALREKSGQATTEDLRQAMIHFRTFFEELIAEPQAAHT
jgi:hypothetical protein